MLRLTAAPHGPPPTGTGRITANASTAPPPPREAAPRPRRTDRPAATSRHAGAPACGRVRTCAPATRPDRPTASTEGLRHDADYGRPRRQRNAPPKNGVQRVLTEPAPSKICCLMSCPRRPKNKISLSAPGVGRIFRVNQCIPTIYGTLISPPISGDLMPTSICPCKLMSDNGLRRFVIRQNGRRFRFPICTARF